MRVFFIIFLLIFPTIPLLSQVKYEKEYRIKAEQVPEAAITFVERLGFQNRTKWYREESLTASTYEAKVRREGQKYSIEFDSTGLLEDVELKIKWPSVAEKTRERINQSLGQLFSSYRLIKIQRQWSGDPQAVLQATKKGVSGENTIERYETIIKGKSETGLHWYEITFSEEGNLQSQKRIILRNTDNLEY